MAEVTMRRKGELIRKLFEILMQQPEGMRGNEAIALLKSQVEPTEHEKGCYDSGDTRFEWIVRFATIGSVKAGWLQKQKGVWSVTEEGAEAYQSFADPEAFFRRASELYRKWRSTRPASETEAPEETEEATEDDTGTMTASITYEQAEEDAWGEISRYLRTMNPYDFQDLVAALLRAMGYHVSWVSPPGKDGGIDILALMDPLGTRPPRIKVQVKRQQNSVPLEGLRSFLALLGDDDVGLFVSTGGFTRDAEQEARTQEKRRVILIDLDRLFDLWVEHYPRLDDDARRRLPLRPIHFLAPEG